MSTTIPLSARTSTTHYCYHCGSLCGGSNIHINDKLFCCTGCRTVYEILQEHQLCDYYNINSKPGQTQSTPLRNNKYEFLEQKDIIQKLLDFSNEEYSSVHFYVPQIHCSSCLWLLENIRKIDAGVRSSRINFTEKEVYIEFDNQATTLRNVVETMAKIGYEPHISLEQISEKKLKHGSRKELIKLGISGFCFANIMMLSLPEYLAENHTLEPEIKEIFKIAGVALSLPVLFYCAGDFFTTAWKSLKNRFLHIDVPVALAVLITFLRSIYEISTGTGAGYLDSMSGIVFFMLIGRFVQNKTIKAISFDRDFKSFFPIAIQVKENDSFHPKTVDQLETNDIIKIHNGEIVPVDAIITKGEAIIDYSFVNGESSVQNKTIGDVVYAGGKQTGGAIEMVVVKKIAESYLTNLWNKDIFRKEKQQSSKIHFVSKHFTTIVFVIAAVAALYWITRGEYRLMWNAITTILIVACPCGLLLAASYTNGNILRILQKQKLYLRHPDIIEELSKIDTIVFDKTGTLTASSNRKVDYEGLVISDHQKQLLAALLQQSTHPLSKLVLQHINCSSKYNVQHFRNHVGQGIEGSINNTIIKIGSAGYLNIEEKAQAQSGSRVYVAIDGDVLGVFSINNTYRSGLENTIQSLQKHYGLAVLSGDNETEKSYISQLFNNKAPLLFQQSPEDKLNYIHGLQTTEKANVLMFGDGLNDSGALKQSNVGIAITENNNNFSPSCDGILDAQSFSKIPQLLWFTKKGQKIIYTTFIVSLLYNFIGIFYSVQGILTPLIAAILMPSSSVSIILLTYGLSEWYAKRFNKTIS